MKSLHDQSFNSTREYFIAKKYAQGQPGVDKWQPRNCYLAGHRCAIPARINQYQYLILKNQVSIPISISIFQISEIDTDFNTNTPDLENQYRYQYQYLSFENSITIPIPILKILSFNINLDLNTKVLQYSGWKNFQLPAVNWKCHVSKLIQTKQFGVNKMTSH